jgi:AN1-type zinc finger and ubiquitin domain-containing protein 1
MNLCSYCNKKKVSLIPFTCKCNPEYKLCNKCRMPESHSCKYDFKTEQRKQLEKDNPVVIGMKIEKI